MQTSWSRSWIRWVFPWRKSEEATEKSSWTGSGFRELAMISKLPGFLALLIAASLIAAAPGRPPIIEAVRAGDQATLKTLLQKGANPNEAEPDGATALH